MRTLLLFFAIIIPMGTVFTQALKPLAEICNNGLDDDADGLIDCYDILDCPCASDHDCTIETSELRLDLDLFWESTPNTLVWSSPIVGNLNPWADSIPEIIFSTRHIGNINGISIFKGDGSNKNNPDFLAIGGNLNLVAQIPAIADLDRNGVPELFMVCSDKKIRIYTNYTPGANHPWNFGPRLRIRVNPIHIILTLPILMATGFPKFMRETKFSGLIYPTP